jgi:uncharacterized membrane protein YkoI
MFPRRLIIAASATALGATLSFAQTTPPATGSSTLAPSGAPGIAAPGAAPAATGTPSRSYAAIQAARIPLAKAIETAERTGGQGRAIAAEFERQDGNEPAHYEIKVVYTDGKLVEHDVDANTGQVLKSENQPIERYFTRLKPADLQAARTSLRDAIALAEQRAGAGARALDAEVDREGSAIVYEIELATPDRRHEMKIDATGQVVGN